MKTAVNIGEVDYKGTLFSLAAFTLANALVFICFAVLWIWEYHINANLSDSIDHVVVPFGWLAGFFIASFVPLRRFFPKIMGILISIGSSVVLSGILFLVVRLILAPFYDPMY
jgi:hypothetical protein